MLSFFAAKGGAGCSVVAAAVALLSSHRTETLLVDLQGDQPDLLGVASDGPGLGEWFGAQHPLPDALRRIEVPVTQRLSLLPVGAGRVVPSPDQARLLAAMLAAEGRQVVVDVGAPSQPLIAVLAGSEKAVLVTRACYLALLAASRGPDPDTIVLIAEPGRALQPADVELSVGAPIGPVIRWDPAVARAVDAGLITSRLPRMLRHLGELL
ncbi:MAG: hypothetical protein ACI8TP_002280 [Acidimicrobiales bacterium]